ncbi:MAG: ABC transporter ATP-binding protein [Deltaproteobacteria bacterium]|nr:ABC transporter ATP-binding protein [Deltaproteobacteria bacterium]
MPLIEIKEVSKVYSLGGAPLNALDKISLEIGRGEFVAIMGPSGSGKSTFMNMLGCLDRPTSGKYILEGVDVSGLDRDELALIRNQKLGFVFQGFNLLSRTSALENVELPLVYSGVPAGQRHERARQSLKTVGLENRLHHHPNQLSGGQQQRVAIARALINDAPIILADEPTGNLDSKTSREIMDLFVRLNTQREITIILVTHESDIAAYSKRVIRFLDGQIVNDGPGGNNA